MIRAAISEDGRLSAGVRNTKRTRSARPKRLTLFLAALLVGPLDAKLRDQLLSCSEPGVEGRRAANAER